MVESRFGHGFPGIWNGWVKGFQPFHQLIAMAARSSARHRLIWSSPQLSIVGSSRFQFDGALVAWPRSSTTLRSDGHRAYVDARTVPRATQNGPNDNPASISFSAERNSGMDDGDLVDHYDAPWTGSATAPGLTLREFDCSESHFRSRLIFSPSDP